MKEFKKNIVTEHVVYEITKEELEKIKEEERRKGRQDVIEYLNLTIQEYVRVFNLSGQLNWLRETIDFLYGRTNSINNLYGYSFQDFIKMCRQTTFTKTVDKIR